MAYIVRLETINDIRPLAVVRRLVRRQELAKVVPESCGIVWSALRSRQVKGAGRHVSVYLDDQINLEVGVELNAPVEDDGDVVGSSLPTGPVATTTHFGPYQKLNEAHQAIHDWCQQNGRDKAGPSWEIYGHWLDEWNNDPSKIRTDVYYLLKPAGDSGR